MERDAGGQMSLDLRPRTWGGARKGAGRKRSEDSHHVPHRTRDTVKPYVPMHVVMRTCADVPRLRNDLVHRELAAVLQRQLDETTFRIVQLSIQHNHLHLIVEADSSEALSKGMHGFTIRAAKAINRACARRGKVFRYRYHVNKLSTPRQVRNALNYVLNNWRHHGEDERALHDRVAKLDRYSSAITFDGWLPQFRFRAPPDYVSLPVARASTFLLAVGWRRAGLLDVHEVPGRRVRARRRHKG